MVECKGVTVRLGRKTPVEDVSFAVPSGELTVLLGQNGSGKTTLLRALNGGVPYQGAVTLDGRDARALAPAERARLVASMPQVLPLPPVSVRRLVSFGRQPYTGVTGTLCAHDRAVVEAVLAQTGLAPLAGQRVDRLSGGERRRAFFAMLLAQEPEILLADEPTANLDPACSRRLLAMLTAQKKAGRTVLTVLHDVNEAFEIADRLLVMEKGRLVFDGTPKEAARSALPQRLFGMEEFSAVGPDGVPRRFYR